MFRSMATLIAVPIIVILLGGGYTALWFGMAGQAEQRTTAWLAARQAAGWTATADGLRVDGFPLAITVTLDAVDLAPPVRLGAWRWQAAQVRVKVQPWSLRTPVVEAAGAQTVVLPTGPHGAPRTYTVSAGTARAALGFDGADRMEALTLTLAGLTARPQGSEDTLRLDALTAAVEALPVEGEPDLKTPTYRVALHGQGLRMPEGLDAVPGPRAQRFDLEARVLGAVPEEGHPHEIVEGWREEGGSLELDRLYVDWEPLEVVATGTAALDQNLQPVAALSARMQGFFDTVGHLEAAGVVRPSDATMARVVLGVMAERSSEGGPPILTVPVTIQNRTLSVGPAALYTFPAITWGALPQSIRGDRGGYVVDRWGNIMRRD